MVKISRIENIQDETGNCPECGGNAKWRSPFYVCEVCGLALRRHEYERMHAAAKEKIWEARESSVYEDPDKKDKKRREYLDWFLSKKNYKNYKCGSYKDKIKY